MARVTPWPFVYRVNWYREGKLRWSRRTTEAGAKTWQECYDDTRAYTLAKTCPPYPQEATEWHDSITIERAPVGDWETIYDA